MQRNLVPVRTNYELPPLELLAIYPTTQRRAVKVKLFVDFIAKRFSGEPEWDRALRTLSPKQESFANTAFTVAGIELAHRIRKRQRQFMLSRTYRRLRKWALEKEWAIAVS